jgi:4-hydroxybenzoate polyprenyltransferase
MVLNDLCDREIDGKREPHRPLVAIPALVPRARILAAALFASGLAFGAVAGHFVHALAIAAFAVAYDTELKRLFPAGILTIGAARAANLSLGLASGGYGATWPALLYVLGYLVYIAAVSAASRAENLEPVQTRRLALGFVGLALLPAYALLAIAAGPRFLLLPAPLHLAALVIAIRAGTRPAAKTLVFRSLLLIFAVHAAMLWSAGRTDGLAPVAASLAASFLLLALAAPRRSP